MKYTISIIRREKITRLTTNSKNHAKSLYNIYINNLKTLGIYGLQLWECRKNKTIDTDALARIIEQHYI